MQRHFETSSSRLFNKLVELALAISNFSHNHKSHFLECLLNRAEPREVKENSQNCLKTKGKSAKHSYLPPH